jgi:hypothetical protein
MIDKNAVCRAVPNGQFSRDPTPLGDRAMRHLATLAASIIALSACALTGGAQASEDKTVNIYFWYGLRAR